MKKLYGILALSLFVISINVAKADFATGLAAYDAGDYSLAFLEWGKAAENGDVAAQRNLGHLYRWGKGVEKNPSRAAYWYHRAAKSGFARAQYSLAVLYLRGEGVPQDMVEAKRWLQKAATQGDDASIKKLKELEKVNIPEQDEVASTQIYGMNKGDATKAVAKQAEDAKKDGENISEPTVSVLNQLPEAQAEKAPDEAKTTPVKTENNAPHAEEKHIVIEAEKADGKVINKITSDNTNKPESSPAPQPTIVADQSTQTAPNTETSNDYYIHLESYTRESDIAKGWNVVTKKVPEIAPLEQEVKQATVKDKLYYRLYAKASLDVAKELCQKLLDKQLYCVIYTPEMKRFK